MNLQTAINQANRRADETRRTWYVVGNGLGLYWTVDRLMQIPMSGDLEYACYTTGKPISTDDVGGRS